MAKPILGCAFLLLIVVGAEAKDPYKVRFFSGLKRSVLFSLCLSRRYEVRVFFMVLGFIL